LFLSHPASRSWFASAWVNTAKSQDYSHRSSAHSSTFASLEKRQRNRARANEHHRDAVCLRFAGDEIMDVSGKTRVCGVIGDPIEHTLSPIMHNAAFNALKLDYTFLAFKVKPAELENAVNGMRALNIPRLKRNHPHKSTVMNFLDRTDLSAQIGEFSQHRLKQRRQTVRLQHGRRWRTQSPTRKRCRVKGQESPVAGCRRSSKSNSVRDG